MLGGKCEASVGLISIDLPNRQINKNDIFLLRMDKEKQRVIDYKVRIGE
jgi:hypothetical protein